MSNEVAFTFVAPFGRPSVTNPMFAVQNYTPSTLPTISIGGAAISVNDATAGSGAFVSRNAATNELWVTINEQLRDAAVIQIAP